LKILHGIELTESILHAPKAILVFSYAPKDVSPELLKQVEAKAKSQGATVVYGVSTIPQLSKRLKMQ
jgi:hypothetical protein